MIKRGKDVHSQMLNPGVASLRPIYLFFVRIIGIAPSCAGSDDREPSCEQYRQLSVPVCS